MSFSGLVHLIFSSSGAFAQDFDHGFLLLTNVALNSEFMTQFNIKFIDTQPKLFTPTFFDFNESSLNSFKFCLRIERLEMISLLRSYLNLFPDDQKLSSPHWELQDRTLFDEDFKKIQENIKQEIIDKAVVMTTEKTYWVPTLNERLELLLNLLKTCPKHLYIYSHWSQNSGVIGASPEFLFYRKDNKLQTMALAGTLDKRKMNRENTSFDNSSNKHDIPSSDTIKFIEDQKELSEHQHVIDDLTEKLAHFSSDIKTSATRVVEFPHLFHLQTEIQATLCDSPNSEAFDYQVTNCLHPSSALGLRSKSLHWHWLKELNGHQNLGYFGAPIGIKVPDGYFCLVGIRNLEWTSKGSYLRAGSGIVSQSNADSEWQELEAKRESVKSLLGLKKKITFYKTQELAL